MKKQNQHRSDQVPTVTQKSSGLEYLKSQLQPRQGPADSRQKTTKND